MKWNKNDDTFILTREELANIMDFLDSIDMRKKKSEIPIGWKEFRREIYIPLDNLLVQYSNLFRNKKRR